MKIKTENIKTMGTRRKINAILLNIDKSTKTSKYVYI